MIGYASRTGTKRNLNALRNAGWRLMISAAGVWRTEGMRYALDNGAWTAHRQGTSFDEMLFGGLVDRLGEEADWIALPDIVCGGLRSLELSLSWLQRLPGLRLIPVQNGMHSDDVRPYLDENVGIFVGGDTTWKEATLPQWGQLAHDCRCYLHVGRIGSMRKIRLCHLAGVDSFDSSGPSRYAEVLPRLDRARRQLTIPWWAPRYCSVCGYLEGSCTCEAPQQEDRG